MHFIYDENTGWRLRPDYVGVTPYKHRIIAENINKDGWRDYDYPVIKREGMFRIGAMGDSFTFGYGVDMEDSYPKALEKLFRQKDGPDVEVLNFGVSGWGLDQTFLGYKNYVRKYKPDILILFYSADTFLRLDYQKMWNAGKPFFVVKKDGSLQLKNVPVVPARFAPLKRHW